MISEKDPDIEGSPKYWMKSNCGPSTVKIAIWGLEENKKKYPSPTLTGILGLTFLGAK